LFFGSPGVIFDIILAFSSSIWEELIKEIVKPRLAGRGQGFIF
jgi:hypothetical protein